MAWSWNVEHFGGGETPARQNRAVKRIKDQDPDIFGTFEVENADIRKLMASSPDRDFFLTDGQQHESLISCRRRVFDKKLFVQKRDARDRRPREDGHRQGRSPRLGAKSNRRRKEEVEYRSL